MATRTSAGSTKKMTFYFGKTRTDGRGDLKQILGGKGANLAEMTGIGLPVPPGFTITTEVCDAYYKAGEKLPSGLMDDVRKSIDMLEKELGKKFGDDKNPLLVSVRSGAAVSMPGMMNTILNLGLNDVSVVGLAKATDNERFAYDAYRRLINMFGDVVMGIDHEHFEDAFSKIKKKYKVDNDTDVPAEGMKELCKAYEAVVQEAYGQAVSAGSIRSAGTGDQGRLCQLEHDACRPLSRSRKHPRSERDSRQRPVHGLRQHGRRFRDGRCLYARPVDRQERILRRVPDQRSGRGCRRGYSNSVATSRKCRSGTEPSTSNCWKSRRRSKTTIAMCRTSSSRSSVASCSCCRPGRASEPVRRP